MITGGDANLRGPPQFGFAFQFRTEVFSVRVDWIVRKPLPLRFSPPFFCGGILNLRQIKKTNYRFHRRFG